MQFHLMQMQMRQHMAAAAARGGMPPGEHGAGVLPGMMCGMPPPFPAGAGPAGVPGSAPSSQWYSSGQPAQQQPAAPDGEEQHGPGARQARRAHAEGAGKLQLMHGTFRE